MDMGVWRQRGRIAGALAVIVAVLVLPSAAAALESTDPGDGAEAWQAGV